MRRLAVVCLVLALTVGLFFLAGCGNKKADTKAGSVETITVWTNSTHSKDLVTQLVEEYNNGPGKEKGIKIEYTVHGGDYQKIMEMAVESDQAPDLLYVIGGKPKVASKGKLIPIAEMPGGEEFLEQYGDLSRNPKFSYDGKVYSVPFNLVTIKLVYNKDLFKEAGIVDENGEARPPKTWDEVREYAKKITAAGGGTKYGIAFPMRWGGYPEWTLIKPFISSVGHDIFNHKTGRYEFSDFRELLDWLLEIKKDKSYFPGPEGLDNDPARAYFSEGKVGMVFSASWDVGVFNDQFPAKIDWGVADIPVLDLNNRYREWMNAADFLCISTMAKKKDLNKVMEVYKWFHSDEFLVKMYENSKFIPYKEEIIQMATKKPDKKGWAEFSNIKNGYMAMSLPDNLISLEGPNYRQVFMQVWTGETTIEKGLADLDRRYNAALDAAIKQGVVNISLYKDEDFDIRL